VTDDLEAALASLLDDAAAEGVWVLRRTKLGDNEPFDDVIASALRELSIDPPRITKLESDPLMFGIDGLGVYAESIGASLLVISFAERTSLGLVRLRVRKAREAIAALTLGISIGARRPDRFGPN